MRLNDADRVIVKWKMALNEMVQDKYGLYPFDFKTVIEWLEAEATAEAETMTNTNKPVRGRNISEVCSDHCEFLCSECGYNIFEYYEGKDMAREFNFCPNCGCDMRGGKNEN